MEYDVLQIWEIQMDCGNGLQKFSVFQHGLVYSSIEQCVKSWINLLQLILKKQIIRKKNPQLRPDTYESLPTASQAGEPRKPYSLFWLYNMPAKPERYRPQINLFKTRLD